jgi:hypothetical protein
VHVTPIAALLVLGPSRKRTKAAVWAFAAAQVLRLAASAGQMYLVLTFLRP